MLIKVATYSHFIYSIYLHICVYIYVIYIYIYMYVCGYIVIHSEGPCLFSRFLLYILQCTVVHENSLHSSSLCLYGGFIPLEAH